MGVVSSARRISWDAGSWVAALIALVAIAATVRGGVEPGRTGPAAWFALLWFGATSYVLLAGWASRRRAMRLRAASVPQGVMLVRPIWIPLQETLQIVAVGAALGVGVALVGFPWVAIGIVLALGALGAGMATPLTGTMGLTFEPSGLRVHLRRGHCLVPWSAVIDVSATPAARSRRASVNIEVADSSAIYASLAPDVQKTRSALWVLLALGKPSGRALWLAEWTGGLDGETLARAVREAVGRPHASQVN
jgi:hypothetical protein